MADFDKNPFPHDGEGKGNCTGYGCDCDEKNYGYYNRSSTTGLSGGGVIALIVIIAIILCMALGCFNEITATLILLIVGFALLVR